MPYQYIASDTVIDKRIVEKLSEISLLAESFECEIRVAQSNTRLMDELDFRELRCVIKALSEEISRKFIEAATQRTDFTDWFTISENYFSESFNFIEKRKKEPLGFNSWLDTLLEIGYTNDNNSQKP